MSDKICSVEGCKNIARHQKYMLCHAHYQKMYKYGDATVALVDTSGLQNKYPMEYNSYRSIKNRCLCRTDSNYSKYGGRGIKICDRWLRKVDGFKNFLEDMGERPEPKEKYSIDRIDVNGDYTPDNCRWADRWTQAGNRKSTTIIPGVHYNKLRDTYTANICIEGKRLAKTFHKKEDAIKQRKEWEQTFLQ